MKLDQIKKVILRHAGLLAGSILGLLSGLHIFGLGVGALIGYFVDELIFARKVLKTGMSLIQSPAAGVFNDRWTRIILSAALACKIAGAPENERNISLAEKKMLEDRILRAPGTGMREAALIRQLIDRCVTAEEISLAPIAAIYREISTQQERDEMIRLLLDVAAGDNNRITAGQNEMLKEVSVELEIPATVFNNYRSSRISVDTEAYEIIGLTPQASDQEIHKVYRRLAAQFHPDTGGHLDDHQRKQSNEAFLKIQQAYNRIIADRNALRTDHTGDPGEE